MITFIKAVDPTKACVILYVYYERYGNAPLFSYSFLHN